MSQEFDFSLPKFLAKIIKIASSNIVHAPLIRYAASKNIPLSWQFDSIIVDEGQDFTVDWFEIIKYFLKDKDKGEILWLEDPAQNISGDSDKKRIRFDNFSQYTCELNFRTPRMIANYILKNSKYDFIPVSDFIGKDVISRNYSTELEQRKIVLSLIEAINN